MTPTLFDLALKAGFSDPIEGWMGEAYEERLEAFAKLIIDHEIATKIANVTGELMDKSVALETVYETIIHWDEGGGKRSRRELARRIVDLYTTPPAAQRQPILFGCGDEIVPNTPAKCWNCAAQDEAHIQQLIKGESHETD